MKIAANKCNILKMENISKSFSGVQALKNVNLDLNEGEILGLVGENGAGKSTLMRILMGIEKMDTGEILYLGEKIATSSPVDAYENGIGMVFQEQALFPNLSVAENIFLGHEEGMITANFLHWRKMYSETEMILEKVGLEHIKPKTRLAKLSFSERQMVEIARVLYSAVSKNRKFVIILDEPTAVLSPSEVKKLFEILNTLRQHASFIFISHHLDEILDYTDRILVLKDGETVGQMISSEATMKDLQEMMVGREFSADFYFSQELRVPEEEIVLKVKDVSSKNVSNISFELHKGEILGIAGLMGCGKEDLTKIIFGDCDIQAGTIEFKNGKNVGLNIKDSVAAGIGYIPSDRRNEGILGNLSVGVNITVSNIDKYVLKCGLIGAHQELQDIKKYIEKLKIKTPSGKTCIANLSGGNQQKVILARWLSRRPVVLLMEQPTRGIDVGAKQEIYRLMRQLAADGISQIVVSDEMPELIGLCNRILTMRKGKITEEVSCQKEEKPNEKDIIKYIS